MSLRTRLLVVAAAAALTSLAACASPHARTVGDAAPNPPAPTTSSTPTATPSITTVGAAIPSSYRFIGASVAVMYRPGGQTSAVDLNRFERDGNVGDKAAISPDGSKIAYVDGPTGTLVVANVDGSHMVKTKIMLAQCGAPVWSPDSRKVLFGENTANAKIETINPDGTGRAVVEADGGCWPVFNVDGSRIAFVSRTGGVVLTDPVAGGGHRTVVTATAKIRTIMSVSMDGHAIVSVRAVGGCGCDDGLRKWYLESPNVLDLATGALTPLTNADGRVTSAYYLASGGMVVMLNGRLEEPPARLLVTDAGGQVVMSYVDPVGRFAKYPLQLAGI